MSKEESSGTPFDPVPPIDPHGFLKRKIRPTTKAIQKRIPSGTLKTTLPYCIFYLLGKIPFRKAGISGD
jgi:hypothetical protein